MTVRGERVVGRKTEQKGTLSKDKEQCPRETLEIVRQTTESKGISDGILEVKPKCLTTPFKLDSCPRPNSSLLSLELGYESPDSLPSSVSPRPRDRVDFPRVHFGQQTKSCGAWEEPPGDENKAAEPWNIIRISSRKEAIDLLCEAVENLRNGGKRCPVQLNEWEALSARSRISMPDPGIWRI
ncbi:hypothetical protein CAPTEDRAFT_198997 [Capitella teleta]|uniref:Uncharacterized protein n=1 Tax=Capitella teleta TaxID=283909 RepID=R7TPF0_CAPTE|nr:hypothetical protein CAPTEDRAFT_198997 [Capitella teleta]|eukprot:ELT95763.1 hypothetical protein CAPTEDRAFT_198997 [Capitella teleta]